MFWAAHGDAGPGAPLVQSPILLPPGVFTVTGNIAPVGPVPDGFPPAPASAQPEVSFVHRRNLRSCPFAIASSYNFFAYSGEDKLSFRNGSNPPYLLSRTTAGRSFAQNLAISVDARSLARCHGVGA